MGINDRVQLADAERLLRSEIAERHMRNGVTIVDPSTTYIDAGVEIGQDARIEPWTILAGATAIGEEAVIGPNATLRDSRIGPRTSVWASIVEASAVGEDARIGPYSHLRPGCDIGPRCRIGNFAELKKTQMGAGNPAHHVSYLGDAEVGEEVNIGAGAITANFDGERKHRTVIGDQRLHRGGHHAPRAGDHRSRSAHRCRGSRDPRRSRGQDGGGHAGQAHRAAPYAAGRGRGPRGSGRERPDRGAEHRRREAARPEPMPEGGGTGSATGNPFLDIAIVSALILASGFFAASELALITVKRHRLTQLAEAGNRSAQRGGATHGGPVALPGDDPGGADLPGVPGVGRRGRLVLRRDRGSRAGDTRGGRIQEAAGGIAFLVTTLLIALVSIVIGELAPKTLALSFTERYALAVARPIGFMERVLSPFVWVVTLISGLLVRALGGKERPRPGYLSTEELKMLVETGSEQGTIEEDEKEMIHGVIELAETKVHEVMVPRIGIRAVEISDPFGEILDMVVRAGHSRIPVFRESLDNIAGILYAKDLLPYLRADGSGPPAIDIRTLVRPPVYVPETKAVDELLHEMQVAKRHIAIVVDEYGGTAGLVTIEDIVEEIVGEIQDEYDTRSRSSSRSTSEEAARLPRSTAG